MSTLSDWEKTRAKLLTLLVINIFEPVQRSVLAEHLSPYAKGPQIRQILNELVLSKKVVKEADNYRLTAVGFNSIVPAKGRFLRDIHRMEHLVQSTKQRGGSGLDDGPSSII